MNAMTHRSVLAPEITGLDIRTDKFKTQRISLTFLLPLNRKDAATASLLSRLLARSTGSYPTPVALQRKLLSLYGARFSSQVLKLGDYQLLNVSISTIADRFALEQEPLAKEAAAFLCDAVFRPNLAGNAFPAQDTEICRRLLIESLESAINDKRKYAISQMYSLMCKNEPFGIEIGGDIETANRISGQDAAAFWQQMLQTAPVVVTVVGSEDPAPVYEEVCGRFAALHRTPKAIQPVFSYQPPVALQTKTETMPLAQGKLVMGFRSNISSMEQNNLALRMMCDIFGGAPYSKLFTVVREKMSLCYYCAARLQSQKGFLCVDSGVDNHNIEAAKAGILEQLSAMQKGQWDDSVMEASKMSMADSVRSVTDSQEAIEAWYLARLFDQTLYSPEEFIRQLEHITGDDIAKAARTVVPDTVYVLKGQEEAE